MMHKLLWTLNRRQSTYFPKMSGKYLHVFKRSILVIYIEYTHTAIMWIFQNNTTAVEPITMGSLAGHKTKLLLHSAVANSLEFKVYCYLSLITISIMCCTWKNYRKNSIVGHWSSIAAPCRKQWLPKKKAYKCVESSIAAPCQKQWLPPPPKKTKKKKKAYKCVESGEMSLLESPRVHNVPVGTLRRQVAGMVTLVISIRS